MALQGSLEDFGLDEVLAMLGAGGKAGRLRVGGPAGTGSIWVDGGRVVGSALGGDDVGADHAETLFHLLRLNDGEFAFLPGERPGVEVDAMAVPEVLALSGERIEEWRDIEHVLPSLEHWLVLSPQIEDTVTLAPKDWGVVARIGSGRRIATIVRALGTGLVPAARDIVSLVQRGVLSVTDETPAEVRLAGHVAANDGTLERQLPSVGAEDGAAESAVESGGADGVVVDDEPAFDLFGRSDGPAAQVDPSIPAPASSTHGSDEWPPTEPNQMDLDDAGDASSDVAEPEPAPTSSDVAEPEPAPTPSDVAEPEPVPTPSNASTSTAVADTAHDEAEVNPRALLRLLNSVR